MEGVLNNLSVNRTGRQGVQSLREPFDVTVQKTGEFREYTLDRNEEYVLEAKIRVFFWANQAQYHSQRVIAERALVARVYADILADIPELMLAISNGDKHEAMEAATRIKRTLERRD